MTKGDDTQERIIIGNSQLTIANCQLILGRTKMAKGDDIQERMIDKS